MNKTVKYMYHGKWEQLSRTLQEMGSLLVEHSMKCESKTWSTPPLDMLHATLVAKAEILDKLRSMFSVGQSLMFAQHNQSNEYNDK